MTVMSGGSTNSERPQAEAQQGRKPKSFQILHETLGLQIAQSSCYVHSLGPKVGMVYVEIVLQWPWHGSLYHGSDHNAGAVSLQVGNTFRDGSPPNLS